MGQIKNDAHHHLSQLPEAELFRLEREVAHRHLGHFPWMIVTWSIVNFAVWLALWPLVLLDMIPLWLGFIIATANVALSYLPSHDAQHSIIAKPGQKYRWLNELVGWVGSIPLTTPYPVLKATHMEHHKYANDPNLDPDYYVKANGPWHAVWRIFLARQPRCDGMASKYQAALERIGRQDLMGLGAIWALLFYGFLIVMAWNGMEWLWTQHYFGGYRRISPALIFRFYCPGRRIIPPKIPADIKTRAPGAFSLGISLQWECRTISYITCIPAFRSTEHRKPIGRCVPSLKRAAVIWTRFDVKRIGDVLLSARLAPYLQMVPSLDTPACA